MHQAYTRWLDRRPHSTPDPRALVVSRARPGPDWTPSARLSAWVTGPDPFEPVQNALHLPDDRHDAFVERLAEGRHAPVLTWSGRDGTPTGRVPPRSAAWLSWRLDEPGVRIEARQVLCGSRCHGWILLAHRPRQLRILDLQAEDRDAHYALLKAARRRSWERGGIPVMLVGEPMSRRYAFTAGYLPSPGPTLWTRGDVGLDRAWEADVGAAADMG